MNLGEKIQALYAEYGALKGVTIELHKQLIAISVKNEAASATVFLQGAQVAEYKRIGERPLLWLSETCDYKQGKSLRGGIPICWPWFGALAKNPDEVKCQVITDEAPAHGFVREQEWTLSSVVLKDSETTIVTLTLPVEPSHLWAYPAHLCLTVTIGIELNLRLSIKNTGVDTFHFTSALHTYLSISDVSTSHILGLEGKNYLDTLRDWQVEKSNIVISIDQEIDRIYTNIKAQVELFDTAFNRRIILTESNAPDLVVWNPWITKSKRLSHFANGAYRKMVCLETARVLKNTVTLSPDAHCQFGMTLSSTSLPVNQ